MKSISLFLFFIFGGIFICCGKQASNTQPVDNGKDSTLVNDTLTTEENDSILDLGGKPLNDIRFDGWGDKDWLDNEYIRCLRKYIDDYKSGKIKDENLDQYKDKIKGKFVIGWAEPSLLGGLFICFIFVDSPDDMFESWVYSSVDAEKEIVLNYEVRSVMLGEDKSGYTKQEILDLVKEHPELKLW